MMLLLFNELLSLVLGVVTALPLIFLLLTTINIAIIMKLNLNNEVKVDISEDKTLLVGEGYGESYYFVLYKAEVYFCVQQESELFIRHYVCEESECAIIFPCYGK